eukprot:763418-Hanusia_phi.AAC.20
MLGIRRRLAVENDCLHNISTFKLDEELVGREQPSALHPTSEGCEEERIEQQSIDGNKKNGSRDKEEGEERLQNSQSQTSTLISHSDSNWYSSRCGPLRRRQLCHFRAEAQDEGYVRVHREILPRGSSEDADSGSRKVDCPLRAETSEQSSVDVGGVL